MHLCETLHVFQADYNKSSTYTDYQNLFLKAIQFKTQLHC